MSACLIISIVADDRPGLVETLSGCVKQHNGNWLESRMALMAGKFAGIVKVEVADSQVDALTSDLKALNESGWTVIVERSDNQSDAESGDTYQLSLVGNDRPGIVQDVSSRLAAQNVNVLDLSTHYESAAMSAEPLFKTQAKLFVPANIDIDDLKDSLENISNDLMVELSAVD